MPNLAIPQWLFFTRHLKNNALHCFLCAVAGKAHNKPRQQLAAGLLAMAVLAILLMLTTILQEWQTRKKPLTP